ncbi:LIC12077 family protein [Leptospira kirschneri]|uniref:Uncharacterized protein n=1 Tax=Leptospira kirschneri serovar Bulgarica str. Nikolaevo TaxID=1240687 RepID=M6FGL7_9LEPT|nr:hypothetical protein [Leptospira kirschneri]EMK25244.1 hypothetical protein LEP1GSC008_4440 [Leptospira kirschneri serovar Bulgarica str. Nikolaevo]
MVLVKETENEIDRQIRYFLEEKLEGILEEAHKVKKRRQEVLHGKKNEKEKKSSEFENIQEETQLTLWGEDQCEHNKKMDSLGTGS